MELYIYGLGGVLIHFLTKWLESRKIKKPLDIITEVIASVISIIIVIMMVYAEEDLKALYPLTMITTVGLGYTAQSFLRFIIKTTKPKD